MKVIKLIAKTGITKIDFKSLFLDLKPRIKSEVKTAKKETKSPYQAKAKLLRILITKSAKKALVLWLSSVLK
jgi:hypothetical protein